MNYRAQGDAFRDCIFNLLKLHPGIRRIEREFPLDHLAADIFYEETTSFGVARVACECKDYGRPLLRSDLEKIWGSYGPLVLKGSITALRVITTLPPAENAQKFAVSNHFTISTHDQVESDIMDFTAYVRSVVAQFTEAGLDQYYRPATLVSAEDAESWLTNWVGHSMGRPAAIIAGYGMGKTSLALRFAATLAERHLRDPTQRIPILIRLADIATEQDVRGLIGKHFTAQNKVSNFHYALFAELNRRGRFVIIFDGFDEMKHTMSFDDLRYNFAELNQLVDGNARVLLLGRPSVFKDNVERNYALHGIRSDSVRRAPESPDYLTVELGEFDTAQAMSMMEAYGAYRLRMARCNALPTVCDELFQQRLGDMRADSALEALCHRPVQARMLTDLALDPQVEWRQFSRTELYREFVQLHLARETSKAARRHFSREQRAAFQRKLAWWMWSSGRAMGFEARVVPASLYSEYVAHEDHADGVLRDLLTGSLLETKAQERFFFSHRSYMEFLVAEHHALRKDWGPSEFRKFAEFLTPEIFDFIRESPDLSNVRAWFDYLPRIDFPAPTLLIDLIASSYGSEPVQLAASAGIREVRVRYSQLQQQGHREIFQTLASERAKVANSRGRLAMLYGMAREALKNENHGQLIEVVADLLADEAGEMQAILSPKTKGARVHLDLRTFGLQLIRFCAHAVTEESTGLQIIFDFEVFAEQARTFLEGAVEIAHEDEFNALCKMSLQELAEKNPMLSSDRQGPVIARFFERYPASSLSDKTELIRRETMPGKRSDA